MDNILHRLSKALRSALHIPEMEQDMEQLKVLLEEQELRTASTLALLANHQQQLSEQIEGLRTLLAQRNLMASDNYTYSDEQSQKLAASLDELTSVIKKFPVVLDVPIGSISVTQQDDDNKL